MHLKNNKTSLFTNIDVFFINKVVLFIIIYIGIQTTTIQANNNDSIMIKKADALIKIKKYKQAFQLLNESDTTNTNIDITLKKIELVLYYYTNTINFTQFCLSDLSEKDNLSEMRKMFLNCNLFYFPIEKILSELQLKHSNNYKIHKLYGMFFFEILWQNMSYKNYTNETLISLSQKHLKIAVNTNNSDAKSFFALGYLELIKNNAPEAVEYLLQAVHKNNRYAEAYHYLGYAYLIQDYTNYAVEYAIRAFDLYTTPPEKAEAAKMLGLIYKEQTKNDKALYYLKYAQRTMPRNTSILLALTEIYLKTDKISLGYDAAYKLFMYKSTVETLNDIYQIFYKQNHIKDFENLLNELTEDFSINKAIIAYINYQYGIMYAVEKRKLKSKKHLRLAYSTLKTSNKKNDKQIVKNIEKLLQTQ